jgi:RNA polymerase sigma-70 factor (sigma-E family)
VQVDDGFAEFAASRYLALVRRAYLLTGDHGAAEDLVQDALAGLLLAWRRGAVDSPDRYVMRSITNRAISRWRRRSRAEVLTDLVPERPEPDGSNQHSDRDELWRGLARLPQRQRAVLVLRYFEDLPDPEIAMLLGVSQATVRSLAFRAMERLRRDAVPATATNEGVR